MEKLAEKLVPFAYIAYLVVGFIQLFAIADGIASALGIPTLLAYVGAFFLTWIPLLGLATGIYGAHASWDWSWLSATLLFGWPMVFVIIAVAIAGTAEFFGRKSN